MNVFGLNTGRYSGGFPFRWGRKVAFLPICASLLFFFSCEKDETLQNDGGSNSSSFDRKGMLENYGENLIIPGYESLSSSISDLESAASDFLDSPDGAKLESVQDRFLNCYEDWQKVSVYEVGPAKDLALRTFSNTFPCDTSTVEDNISSGNYDLDQFDTQAEKGFPALDYLLFDPFDGDTAVVNGFSSGSNAADRKDYLMDVIADLKGNVEQVLQGWRSSGGDHLQEWVDATGTDVGSSVGLLVNELNYDLEIVKNPEIGIPLGKKSLGNPQPKKCQAYFAQQSLALAEAHLKALRDCYLGKGAQGDGVGLDENLDHIDASSSSGPLDEAIRGQFDATIQSVQAIQSPLSESVVNDPTPVDEAHTELKKLVALLKSDMPSELGVQITYQDNDGD